jgi:hypothetical protein
MYTTKTKARIIKQAILAWHNEGLLDEEKSSQLENSIEVAAFDWKRLARYSFIVSIICLVIAVGSIVSLPLFAVLFANPVVRLAIASVSSVMMYYFAIDRMKKSPLRTFSNEAIMLTAVLATAWAVTEFGAILDSGSDHFSVLILLACIVYLCIGWLTKSGMVWLFALISLGAWLGAETAYISGWGVYYFSMNYPLLFVVFGGFVTAASLVLEDFKGFKPLFSITLKVGLLYLFMALWIMSIFGNQTSFWLKAEHLELFVWVLLFAAAAVLAIWLGMKKDSGVLRGYGIVFLLINIYTRFFEYFWDGLHKGIFFGILGLSLWLLASKAEKIWRALEPNHSE